MAKRQQRTARRRIYTDSKRPKYKHRGCKQSRILLCTANTETVVAKRIFRKHGKLRRRMEHTLCEHHRQPGVGASRFHDGRGTSLFRQRRGEKSARHNGIVQNEPFTLAPDRRPRLARGDTRIPPAHPSRFNTFGLVQQPRRWHKIL